MYLQPFSPYFAELCGVSSARSSLGSPVKTTRNVFQTPDHVNGSDVTLTGSAVFATPVSRSSSLGRLVRKTGSVKVVYPYVDVSLVCREEIVSWSPLSIDLSSSVVT